MVGLWRAEWMKLTHHLTSRIVLALFLGATAAAVSLATFSVLRPGNLDQRQAIYSFLGFPNGFTDGLRVLESVSYLLVPIFFASVFGSEYAHDTWKNMLIRQNGRLHFLVVKGAIAVVGTLIILALTLLGGVVFAALAGVIAAGPAASAGLHPVVASSSDLLNRLTADAIVVGPVLAVASALAVAGTMIGRSTVAGIIPAIVWTVGDQALRRLVPELKALSVATNAASLQQYQSTGKADIDVTTSLLVIAVYLLIPLVAAGVIFRQRDIAG